MRKPVNKKANQSKLPVEEELNINDLEQWLWDAACSIRGAVDAPKFKDYILPLTFVKRLSDVFEDEIGQLAEKFGDRETALEVVEDDHSLVRFYPPECSWHEIRKLTANVGQRLTEDVRKITKAHSQRFRVGGERPEMIAACRFHLRSDPTDCGGSGTSPTAQQRG